MFNDNEFFSSSKELLGISAYRGGEEAVNINIIDIPNANSYYKAPFLRENPMAFHFPFKDYDTTNPLNSQYLSSSILYGSLNVETDFLMVRAKEIIINYGQTYSVNINANSSYSHSFAAHSDRNNGVGRNPLAGTNFEKYMTRGGDGNTLNDNIDRLGGIGFSGASNGRRLSYFSIYGGGFICLIADKIMGKGTIEAKGYGIPSLDTGSGGGGMVTILVKEWAGETGINVSGGRSYIAHGQDGSYAIFKIEADGSTTLMVHSQNGVAADLNGQTPVHGADASVAW